MIKNSGSLIALLALLGLALGVGISDAQAQSYTQLQVLLPGETANAGSPGGKTGTPLVQTVGTPFTVTVRAVDASWNLVSSITHQVELSSSDQTANLPAPHALQAGETQFQVTINAAGSFDFSAADLTDITIPSATSASVQAILLQGFEFGRINQKNQYAGQPMAIDLWAVDPSGNPVGGYDGPVRLRQLTSFGEGRIEPSVVNMVDGNWSGNVTMYRADQTAINRGNVNIYAVLDGDPTRNGTSDPFTVHPGNFSQVQIVVPGQTAEPGSVAGLSGSPATQGVGPTQAFTVDVWATDDYWNPVPSADTVRLISSDGASNTPLTTTLNNGFGQFTVYLGTVGTQTLTVTNQTNGSISGMTSAGIPVIAGSISQFVIEPISGPVTAGEPVSVTIRAADGSGNTVVGYFGEANLAANTGPNSISPERVSFTNGVWTGDMVFRGAGGAVSFSCADFSSPPHTGSSNNFEVLPGPYVGLQVRVPGELPAGGTVNGVSGKPDDQNAGTSFNITVRAVDEFWNRVPGVNANLALSSSDAFADLGGAVALNNGEAIVPVTLFRSGYQTISAADADDAQISAHTSNPINVLPGTYSRVLILAPGQIIAHGTETGQAGTATDQSINYAFTVTVYATDQWWNPVSGITDVVRITSNDPLAELPPDTPMVDGVAQLDVRLSTGGYQQITAQNVTQPGMPTSTTEVRAISSGFHLEAVVSSNAVQAGEYFDITVKVTNDAGSVIQEINSGVTLTVRNAGSGDPGAGDLMPGVTFQLSQGEETVSVYYTKVENIIIIATDDLNHDPAITETITVSPGDPFEIQMSSNPSWVGGNKRATVSARVADRFDNGVPAVALNFGHPSGMGELTPIDLETDETGTARADFLSSRTPGMDIVTASAAGLSQQLQIETALVDPNADGGTITNYPNPFHPGEAPTTIAYKLDDNAAVRLRIYTLTGNLVFEQRFDPATPGGTVGLNEFVWDGTNGENKTVASGGYIVEVHAEGNGETLHLMRRKIGVVR